MRHVFSSSSDTIHAYAQRPNDPTAHGRSGNVYFEGGKLYSYGRHYVLAEWLDDQTVLIDNQGYSVNTAKHIGQAMHGLSQYQQFFTMDSNPQLIGQQLREYRNKLAKARKPELYTDPATALIGRYVEWLDYSGKAIDPELTELIQHFTGEGIKERIEADKERIEAQRKEDERKRKEYERLYREAFMSYEPSGDYRSRSKVEYDLIRFKKDEPQTVETSQNVRIPYAVALEAFTRFKGYGLMKGQHVAGFTVHEIAPEFIRIGCHRFRIEDLNQFFNVPTV
jgi:hypothetical protein